MNMTKMRDELFGAIGWKYVKYGRERGAVDCYGLATVLYQDVWGIVLPDFAYQHGEDCARERSAAGFANLSDHFTEVGRHDLLPGDIIAVAATGTSVTHMALAINKQNAVHAVEPAVRRFSVLALVMQRGFRGAYRHNKVQEFVINARDSVRKQPAVKV